jgi:mitogen-activated protein kinase 1/3
MNQDEDMVDFTDEEIRELQQLEMVEFEKQKYLLPKRYKILKSIGSGAYGTVVSAFDKLTNEHVAIKKIVNVFEKDREYQKRILREVKVLTHLRDHDNIVSLKDLPLPKSFEEFEDVYIVTDLMDADLRSMIKSDQTFTDSNIQYFLYQMLRAMKYVHSANILHRDLKPANVLLNKALDVKICDFGLSRGVDDDNPTMSTTYVATRWYRAPELLLMWDRCTKPIDVWSVGCIMAEMLGEKRKPLFPGKTYLNQLDLILNVTGTPRQDEIHACKKAMTYMKTLPVKPKADLSKKYPNANPLAIDLLGKLLTFDPLKRITVEEALAHPYLADFHDPEEEPVCEEKFLFSLDNSVETSEIKHMMYNEILKWHEMEYDRQVLRKLEKEEKCEATDDPLEQILVNKLMSTGKDGEEQQAYFNKLIAQIGGQVCDYLQKNNHIEEANHLKKALERFNQISNDSKNVGSSQATEIQKDLEMLIRESMKRHNIDIE